VSVESTLLVDDINARRDALDVSRSFIVQAPAGSGKTELLIQRYLRLLAVVAAPEEIIAITFTRKAAQEMRLRVLGALQRAEQGIDPGTDHERLTLSLADSVLERDREHGWQLVSSPGRMRIETIDAFGSGIARSLPLSSGLGGATGTITDAEVLNVYRQAATATIDYLDGNDEAADAVARVLAHLDSNLGLYIDYVSRMLASREQWLSITGGGQIGTDDEARARRRLEKNIEDVVDRHLELLNSLLTPVFQEPLPPLLGYAAGNLISAGKADHDLAVFGEIDGLPLPEAQYRHAWRGIANLMLTAKGQPRKSSNVNDGFPPEGKPEKAALKDIVERLDDLPEVKTLLHACRALPDPHYTDSQWQVLLALLHLLPLAVAELKRLFAERGLTDHNEVAISAGRALGTSDAPGDVALMLDYQVRHLLIDEMQDTSISQYDLLKKLTAGWEPGDGRSIFCVGDPMQSIYRFRDAEVGEFLLARDNGIGDLPLVSLTLRQNFRSGENLVRWFNHAFLQVMPLKDDVAVGAISYSESVPISAKAGQGHVQLHPLIEYTAGEEADYVLDVIRGCLDASSDEDVAVLVRSRTQLSELLPRLRAAGIPYNAVEIDRLTDLPEVIDLIALTRVLVHEGDRLAWLALLRGPLAGLCWDDLLALTRDDARSTIAELCADDERMAGLSDDGRNRVRHLLSVLGPIRRRYQVTGLSARLSEAWHSLGGPATLTDAAEVESVQRFFTVIDKLDMAGTIEDVLELEDRLDAERVSSMPSGDCRCQIMTMHKAKGLQFDHVVLPSLGRQTKGSSKEVLNWLNIADESGSSEMLLSPVGSRAELEQDPLHQFIETTEKEKIAHELDRLLYVACTRARQSLHLVGNAGIAADGTTLKNPDGRSLLSRLWRAVEDDYLAARDQWLNSDDDAEPADSDGGDCLVLPVLRRFAEPWRPPEISGPTSGGDEPEDSAEEQPVEFYWVGAAARHAGTIVHRWLQRIGESRTSVAAASVSSLRPTSRRWAASLGVPGDDIDRVVERVEEALAATLSDEKGCWILEGDGHCELALTGVQDGRVESIVIDRVRVDADGTHWIIDYKTSSHEGGDLTGFLQQEADRYRAQLTKYAAMYRGLEGIEARTALYFPLLRQFLEVTPD
jgi:ATP-dependent helicase/nuclease subunit A